MPRLKFTKPKRRRNPKGMCGCCGEKIKNKLRSSLYCKSCAKEIEVITNRIHGNIKYTRNQFPDFKIKIKVIIKKK